ncbi:hypothetical protein CMU68_10485 [Elizabethkingia anophelis]|nr:hypothetical protein [Elizabethkingia anophelis]MDV3678788.1 hypothetical protein [Elizabethkingia anophelis]
MNCKEFKSQKNIMTEIKLTKRNGYFKSIFRKIISSDLNKVIDYKVKVQGENTTVVFTPQKKANIDMNTFNSIVNQLFNK